jgi:hypothetical protein
MSDAISRITEHFNSLGIRKLDVPEWGMTIYSTPVTVAERTRIYRNSKGDNDYETVVEILLVKSLDEKGAKLFTAADKPALLQKADSNVCIRVAAWLMSSDTPKADELKNS